MSTEIRPEVSKKSEYYIPKDRYYELKHFVMQYKEFSKMYVNLVHGYQHPNPTDYIFVNNGKDHSDPTVDAAILTTKLSGYMDQIISAADETDPVIGPMIFKNVSEGYSYDNSPCDIPCCKETYYKLYRKFFWLLSGRH